jgi:hypothetical protein
MPVALLPLAAAMALLAAGCGMAAAKKAAPAAPAAAPACPAAYVAAYRKLARQVDAPVYCPTWLPQPLDAQIGGEYAPAPYVDPNRSYLLSFIWFEMMPSAPYEVHVNLRGYPGHTAIPMCQDTLTTAGRTVNSNIPCFADPRGTVKIGHTIATVYTANQGADTWHVLYAWRHDGSLYTVSQHVAPPFTYTKVVQDLNRMLRGLVLVQP